MTLIHAEERKVKENEDYRRKINSGLCLLWIVTFKNIRLTTFCSVV